MPSKIHPTFALADSKFPRPSAIFTPPYLDKLRSMFGSSIVALWPQNEASGSVSQDIGGRNHPGAYTGVTLGVAGIGDENTAASYDGTTSFNNVYSVGLNTDFNNQEGTLLVWAKVSGVGVWTDATARALAAIGVNGSTNLVVIKRIATNNLMQVSYIANSVGDTIFPSLSSLVFFSIAITWSKSGDAVKVYVNGVQSGATQTGLGAWVGALGASNCVIGAANATPTQDWSGSLGPVLVLNRPATLTEVAQMCSF